MNFVKLMSAGALALLAFATSALAQTYPTRPITLIVPWPAGGSTDTHLRKLAELAGKNLGQPICKPNETARTRTFEEWRGQGRGRMRRHTESLEKRGNE